MGYIANDCILFILFRCIGSGTLFILFSREIRGIYLPMSFNFPVVETLDIWFYLNSHLRLEGINDFEGNRSVNHQNIL